jgi:hypothetical protein
MKVSNYGNSNIFSIFLQSIDPHEFLFQKSEPALESLLSLVELSQKDHESLLLVESFIFKTMTSNNCGAQIARANERSDAIAGNEMQQKLDENSVPTKNDLDAIGLSSNDGVEDKVNKFLEDEQCTERSDESHENFTNVSGESQFIIVNANDEAEEKEKTKWIERRKSDIRRNNGKLMPPLSQSTPRTCHASPSISLAIKN